MRTERKAFEAWLVRRAMRQVFSDQQVADLRRGFNAGWAARDSEFVAPEAQGTSSVTDDDCATTHPAIVRSGSAGMIVCEDVFGRTSRLSKVLVIDDDGTVRAFLAALLGKFGHEAVLASNTMDGIAAAESGSIDVALIDMNMPGLDSSKPSRRLRASNRAFQSLACRPARPRRALRTTRCSRPNSARPCSCRSHSTELLCKG